MDLIPDDVCDIAKFVYDQQLGKLKAEEELALSELGKNLEKESLECENYMKEQMKRFKVISSAYINDPYVA